jgi:hypothetical protein
MIDNIMNKIIHHSTAETSMYSINDFTYSMQVPTYVRAFFSA